MLYEWPNDSQTEGIGEATRRMMVMELLELEWFITESGHPCGALSPVKRYQASYVWRRRLAFDKSL